MAPPDAWGPSAWDLLHYVATGYPVRPTDRDVAEYGAFYRALQPVLPCASCRDHLKDNLDVLPPDGPLAGGRAELFAWTVALHNLVNSQLKKPQLSMEAAYRKYFELRAPPLRALALAVWIAALVLALALAGALILAKAPAAQVALAVALVAVVLASRAVK